MNITPNYRLLELLSKAVESTLIPELSSSNAKAVAGIVQAVLADLLKRENRTPGMLLRVIADGEDLLAEMAVLLGDTRRPPPSPHDDSKVDVTLAASIERHAALTRELANLSEHLVSSRHESASPPEQDLISTLLRRAARWEIGYYTEQQQALDVPLVPHSTSGGPLTPRTLEAFIQSRHPDGPSVSITAFSSIPGGFGKQTSRFTLRDASGHEQELIVRKSDPNPMLNNAGFIIENEFHLLSAVSASGYTAPRPLWLGTGIAGVDASFYVMECLPGKIPGSFLGGLTEGDSEPMLLDVAAKLGQLHALPISEFADYIRHHDDPALLGGTVESCYRRQIVQWRHYAADVEHLTSPFLHYLIDWLERHVPADSRAPVLLHGDFNIHNLLVESNRVTGVLDWECAMFGAPEQDLAYIQPHISQSIDWNRFVDRYRQNGGRDLQLQNMPYYLAFSALRLHIAMLRATRNLQSGANDDIRYAMVELGFGVRFMELAMAGTGGLVD